MDSKRRRFCLVLETYLECAEAVSDVGRSVHSNWNESSAYSPQLSENHTRNRISQSFNKLRAILSEALVCTQFSFRPNLVAYTVFRQTERAIGAILEFQFLFSGEADTFPGGLIGMSQKQQRLKQKYGSPLEPIPVNQSHKNIDAHGSFESFFGLTNNLIS